jgi:DNA primase catalytic core
MELVKNIIRVTNLTDILETAEKLELELDQDLRTDCFGDHHSADPTLRIDPDTQSFYCADPTCRTHGSAIDLVRGVKNIDFLEATNMLASESGVETIPNPESLQDRQVITVLACLNAAATFYAKHSVIAAGILQPRAISVQTVERFLVGSTANKDGLKEALQEQGFDETTIRAAGLLNRNGGDFFFNRIMVPIRVNGVVIGFYGRASYDQDEFRHLRLSNDRLIKEEAPFNWNSRHEEIVVVEGVMDALALIDKGFINTVAVMGTQGLSSEQYSEFLRESAVRKIFLCYDGDEAGQRATVKDGYRLEDQGFDVRVLDLDNRDPNEYVVAGQSGDLQDRLDAAVTPVQWDIDHVNPDLSPEAKIESIEHVLLRCKRMQPLQASATIKRLSDVLGFTKKEIRNHIDALTETMENQQGGLDLTNCLPIHPALDVVGGLVIMTVPQAHIDAETGTVKWEPYIVTSDRDFFMLDPWELHKRGFYTTSLGMADEPRYSAEMLQGFLYEDLHGSIVDAFWLVWGALTEYLDFSDERTHVFLAGWIIGTYLYPVFNYYPYLHFTGTKNVGKSKTMKLMSCLCFNGTMSVSITTASQFRIIEAFRPTLFMDETEDLQDKAASDRRAVLLGGYESGSSVIRTEKEKDRYRAKRMGNYGPRAFASIEGLDDTLASRTGVESHTVRTDPC